MLSSSKAVQGALYTNTTITALLNTVTDDDYPAIFNDNPVPSAYETVFPSINHYRSGAQSASQEWTDTTYVVNCWAVDRGTAETIQETVASELADTYYDGFYILINILPTIPIAEMGGIYNAPLEFRVRKNQRIGE